MGLVAVGHEGDWSVVDETAGLRYDFGSVPGLSERAAVSLVEEYDLYGPVALAGYRGVAIAPKAA